MTKKDFFNRISAFTIPFKKSLALLLVFVLLFSQTVRFDFLSVANASSDQYRDIVSIVVDRETERRLRSEIRQYAEDIQNRLGSTRVVISVIDENTTPAMIASQNEKWYYEGDGEEWVKSQLVGTILIGNVPIPMVNSDGKYFPSVFPYVDFENKAFLYNEKSDRYEKVSALNGGIEAVEIWHGVINPAVGRAWAGESDILFIRDFLDKTHNFYTENGRFASINEPPRVFYFDAFSESKSIELRRVFQYSLWIQNIENFAYSRFSKYLLRDINNALKNYDKQNDSGYADLIAGLGIEGLNAEDVSSNTLSDDLIDSTPDIHTKPVIEKLVSTFSEIFNTKVLGEELKVVHNAGRYNSGANVRADLGSVHISVADGVASDTLKKANDALESSFTEFLKENSVARKIPILDGMTAHYGDAGAIPYANYFFGQEGKNITSAEQCTIARGVSGQEANFGQSILVEANVAFDVNATQSHVDLLGQDAPRCYAGSTPHIQTFWGGNTLLRVANETNLDYNPLARFPEKKFTGFVKNIFSQGGMLESDRIEKPSLSQCMDYSYQYTLKQPYSRRVPTYSDRGSAWRTEYYPSGTNGTYFACNSQVDVVSADRMVRQTYEGTLQTGGTFGRRSGTYNPNDTIPVRPDADILSEAARYSNNTRCLVGDLNIDGHKISNNNKCVYTYTVGWGGGRDGGGNSETFTVDYTNYRTLNYHTIDGILYHISPTEEEIAAADENGATPSLPININRSVEFLTKKGNIATIAYPNFYRMDATTVEGVRAWLREDANRQWSEIFARENATNQSEFDANISENILGAKNLPQNFDWNDYISDELIVQILQAKNWLHPDITKKYQDSVESMLSYSQSPSNGNILQKIPATSAETEKMYEIAYLGLSSVAPMGDDSQDDFSSVQNDYAAKLAAIQGFNITDDSSLAATESSVSSSAHCGPPDGVELFQWPSAVKCWIKTQIPVKIGAGQCGGDTIGYDPTASKPVQNIPNSEDISVQKAAIADAEVIPHFTRKHISHFSSLDFYSSLQTDSVRIQPTNNSQARLEIISVTSGGETISPEKYSEYFSYNASDVPLHSSQSQFIVTAKDKNFSLTARVVYDIRLSDGSIEKKFSKNFTLTASSEYLDANISTENGTNLVAVTADSDEKIFVNILRKKSLTDVGVAESDFEMTIFDDLNNYEITKISWKNGRIELGADIAKRVGVYRAVISGADGVSGEFTFSVVSGPIASAVLNPVSSMILKDSTTIVTLSLQDRLGNAVSPDLYNIELSAENGSIIDAGGNAKKSLSLSIFDSSVAFMVRGEKTGEMKIFAKISNHSASGNKELTSEKTLKIIDSVQVGLQFENSSNAIKIGSSALPVRLQIRDSAGNTVTGFSSIATISVPAGAGKFSQEVIEIKNGQSENFTYIPGTVAGVHNLTLNIPGIGILSETPLTLMAGDGMYIDHTETADQLIFTVRDRYGNIANYSGAGRLTYNAESPQEVTFENGKYTRAKTSGYYMMEVPDLQNNNIIYEEAGKEYVIEAIARYAVQIFTNDAQYQFANDYNARYTVLAGGSFLREAEDIIFHTDKNNSQSLAASTLLSSPLAEETIISVFPNGGYSVGQLDDMVLETSLNIERKFPVLHVLDSVRKTEIAKILYNFEDAQLLACKASDVCDIAHGNNTIAGKLLVDETLGYNISLQNKKIFISSQGANLLSIDNTGAVEAQSSVSFSLRNYDTTHALVIDALHNGAKIAEISFQYAGNENVALVENIFQNNFKNISPRIQTSGYQIENFSDKIFGNSATGIVVKRSLSYNIYDESKIGPTGIDDIGTLAENPGVGWMGDNRMLLSYAAGDTVGEATKWFQTYMLVNMGDPVASVKHGAADTEIDGLDKTIGTQIADSRKSQIHDFFQKDMNADNLPDVLVQYSDGFMELLLNIGGKFRSAGNIAYLPRLRNSLVQVADFQGDKFSDIISLDDEGKLRLISNSERKFTEQEIVLTNNTSAPKNIQQMKILDMDTDGKEDLVYLTSGGQLGILYGTEKAGTFEQKILDETLGITLKQTSDTHGGALKSNFVAQPQTVIGQESSAVVSSEPGLTDTRIQAEVYYQERVGQTASLSQTEVDAKTAERLSALFSDGSEEVLNAKSNDNTLRTTAVPLETFIRSQYASLVGMEAVKNFAAKNNILYPDDAISVEISIKNNNSETATGVKYLDTIPEIFARDNSLTYSVEVDGKNFEKNFVEKNSGDYDLEFEVGDIPAGATAKIRYTLSILPMSYGEMLVWDFEKGLAGHDNWGDIAFHTSTTCGAEMMAWYSKAPREYDSSHRPATYNVPLPNGISEKISDADGNNIPDSVENMTPAEGMAEYKKMAGNSSQKKDLITVEKDGKRHYRIGFDEETAKNITDKTQEIVDGLACGFGGGSCMSFPINWAPLAPGNDPVVFGSPVGDGFKVEEGLPVFSALTAVNVPVTGGCYQIPTVWPASPLKFQGSCTAQTGAGGYLKSSPTNFVRVFATPTLTLGMGAAVCLGGPANVVGGNPGKGLSPLVQWGNCIVMTKTMPICKWDGSIEDGDISGISGLGVPGTGTYTTRQVWNGGSCSLSASPVAELREEERQLEAEILDYMKSPSTKTANIVGITAKISKRNISSLNNGPLLNIGSGGSDIEVSVSGKDKISDISAVVNVKNKRISAFPDFIMDWLTRQTEELTNSLFTPPNLTIIPPTDFGQNAKVDSSYADFLDKLQNAYSAESVANMKSEMSTAYNNTNVSTADLTTGGNSWLGSQYESMVNSATSSITPALNSGEGGLNAMRAAYAYIWKLPFIKIRETRVNINVPWILPSELDQYERKLKEYQRQIDNALTNWCAAGETKECLEAKIKLNSSGFVSSIQANLKRIEEYRQFPDKLQKYVTWKEKLLYDILCNIEAVEKMTFGWVKENGVRFQKWAELYVLIKAIAESWQPLVDIFAQTNAQCGVCRNERHNSQAWKFKLISAVIPQIPVISFPKWPDVVLDLSDVRLGIDIAVPDFNFRISPMKLPSLPSFSLPTAPTANFSLPSLPVLPALPSLPDLPELPSLPMVDLPDLPPPPKLPKLSGSIKASLDILKLIAKMYCYYQNTVLIPEWQVGDVIAQRTERQGTLSMDFLDIQFPQFSVPTLKEIRISTHLNYTLRTDFLTEFAQNAVKPINQFTTDLSNKIPSQIDALEKAVDKAESGVHNLSDSVHDAVDSVEDSARDTTNSLQKSSDEINNQSRNLENSWQDASDNLENKAQETVDEAARSVGYSLENMGNLLEPIIVQMEADKDVFLDTDEFYAHFKSELLRSGFVAQAANLDKKMQAAKIESQQVQNEILDYNTRKFSLLRDYIAEQERKTGEMQNIVDLLRSNDEVLLSSSPYVVANLASENVEQNSSLALSGLAELEKEFQKSLEYDASRVETVSSYDIGRSLQNRVKRIAQLTTTETTTTTPAHSVTTTSAVNDYLPKFEGMYVLTEVTHTQTKLFSYTELVRPEDRVDVLDIDNDGDKDYVFVLGGKLYVKNTHLTEPTKIFDKKITTSENFSKNPEVANNFMQVLSTPSELNVSFQNTVPNETQWRMEFYDKYLEWDRMDIQPSEYNTIARTTVDLLLNDDFGEYQNGVRSLPVARYLARGENASSFMLEWPKIEKISQNIFVSISPNRAIYTGNNDVFIRYKTSDNPSERTMTLRAHTAYQFDTTTEIIGSGGDIFIIGGGTGNYVYSESDRLSGLPLLPWMRLTSSETLTIRDATHRKDLVLPGNSTYIVKSLGVASDMYNFTIPYPNGHYYARLQHLSSGKNYRTATTLVAPQFGSDATSPVISLTDAIRVPVYAQEKFQFSDIITELSSYSVQIDEDTSVDADGNGVYDDDFSSARTNVLISDQEIIFGPFDEPGNRQMLLKVRDEFGNVTYMPLIVEIFTPIPNIQTLSNSGYLSGQLDTTTDQEPIDFFRIRASEYPFMINSESVLTENGGKFGSGSFYQDEKIFVKSLSDTFEILKSGIFDKMPAGYEIRVSSAHISKPMSIDVYNVEKQLVYQQFLSLPSTARVVDKNSVSGIGNLVISAFGDYKLVLAGQNDPQIPGGAYITDANHDAIIVVARDGNIYTLDNPIVLQMTEKSGFILITAYRGSEKIAEFHYQMNFFYTNK